MTSRGPIVFPFLRSSCQPRVETTFPLVQLTEPFGLAQSNVGTSCFFVAQDDVLSFIVFRLETTKLF